MGDGIRVEQAPAGSGGTVRPADQPASRMAGGIGRTLEQMRAELVDCGKKLESLVEPTARDLVQEAAALLNKQVCRIAVVGQIKSGKSSFINAFSQQANLLPTDVNPWTTAVTQLHFRQPSRQPGAGSFTFFTEEEWRRLAEGGGKLRELTERLVPGFEPELLRQQVHNLQRRAAARLGDEYRHLLGKAHDFDVVNPDVLKRYVCAGELVQGLGEHGDVGKFSDITKAADLYCEDGPFSFPVTIIDTPGTNDPFLLRDEITRRSLEAADLYIIVLTARQPLSEADVALLRILRGLNKDRLIIFINRIDDLADIGHDLAAVKGFVKKRIAQEFPDADIPIIAGSARWANSALSRDAASVEPIFERRSLAFFTEAGLLRREDLVRPAGSEGSKIAHLADALFVCSGMPAMYKAVSDTLNFSHCAHVIRQVSHCYLEMARSSESSTRSAIQHLDAQHTSALNMAHKASDEMRGLDREIQQLQQITEIIQQSSRNIEEQLADMISEELATMRSRLEAEVDAHADEERDVLIDTLRRGRAPKEWKCEAIELRRRLANEFLRGFQSAAARVLDLQNRITPELRQLMAMISPQGSQPPEPSWNHLEVPAPSLSSLSGYIALDLDVPWWSAWMAKRPTPEERGEQVAELIRDEFAGVVDELVASARDSLESYSDTARRWSFGVCSNIVEALQRRREQLRQTYENVAVSIDGNADTQTVTRQAQQLAELKERLVANEAMSQQLAEVVSIVNRAMSRTSS